MAIGSSCLVELILGPLATGAFPIVGKIFERYAVVLGRVIDITADGTDVLAGRLFGREVYLLEYGRNGIVKIHHPLGLQVLIALRGVGSAIHRGMLADELANAVLRLAC